MKLRIVTAGLILAVAIGASVIAARAAITRTATSLPSLPASFTFGTVSRSHGQLTIAPVASWITETGNQLCDFQYSQSESVCGGDLKRGAVEPVIEFIKAVGGSNYNATIHVLLRSRSSGQLVLRPTLMTFVFASNTMPAYVSADQSLWIYDCSTTSGSELVRVSEATGIVVRTTAMPDICRPMLLGGRSGLWMVPAGNSDGSGMTQGGIYFVPVSGGPMKTLYAGKLYAPNAQRLLGNGIDQIGTTTWIDAELLPGSAESYDGLFRFDGDHLTHLWRLVVKSSD